MRIALYARKSTESEDRQVQSLDDQLNALRALAAREGLRITETFIESRSAKAPNTRPEFRLMVERIEAGEIDGVLTWAVNRLSRNPVDGGTIAYLLQTGKLKFIRTIEKSYRPEDSALLLSIETGMATDYVRNLSRDVKRGMESKAMSGWQTSRAPLGYVNNLLTHEMEPDSMRFPLMRKGFEMMMSGGYTVSDVHRELTRLGLTSAGRKASGRPISHSALYVALSNPFYCGQITFRGEVYPGKHRPLVTEQEFDRVQERLNRPLRRRLHKHDHAYGGLLKCGACGCSVVAERKVKHFKTTGNTREYVYYHCSGGKGCVKRGVSEERLNTEFLSVFESVAIPVSFAQWARAALKEQANVEAGNLAIGDDQAHLRAEQEKRRLSRLSDMLLDGDVTREEYNEKRAELKDRLWSIESDLVDVRGREDRAFAILDERLNTAAMADSYGQYANTARRAMVRALGPDHYLTLEKVDIRLSPVMQRIAAFEPLRNDSEKPKAGDPVGDLPIWQGFLDSLRTAARLEAAEEAEESARRAEEQHHKRRPEKRMPVRRNRPPEPGHSHGSG